MCIGGKTMGNLINPTRIIAPKSGAGEWLDPAAAIGKRVGGQAGAWIDPANTTESMMNQTPGAYTFTGQNPKSLLSQAK